MQLFLSKEKFNKLKPSKTYKYKTVSDGIVIFYYAVNEKFYVIRTASNEEGAITVDANVSLSEFKEKFNPKNLADYPQVQELDCDNSALEIDNLKLFNFVYFTYARVSELIDINHNEGDESYYGVHFSLTGIDLSTALTTARSKFERYASLVCSPNKTISPANSFTVMKGAEHIGHTDAQALQYSIGIPNPPGWGFMGPR